MSIHVLNLHILHAIKDHSILPLVYSFGKTDKITETESKADVAYSHISLYIIFLCNQVYCSHILLTKMNKFQVYSYPKNKFFTVQMPSSNTLSGLCTNGYLNVMYIETPLWHFKFFFVINHILNFAFYSGTISSQAGKPYNIVDRAVSGIDLLLVEIDEN